MTTEVTQDVQESVENTNQDDLNSGFEAGFAEARGVEPPVEEPKQAEQPTEAPEQVEEPTEAPTEAPEEQPLMAGLTESQIKSLLLKAGQVDEVNARIEKAFGKLGEFNRTIQQLSQQRSSANLSPEKMTRLRESFPEIAELLAADLSDALTVSESSFDPKQVDELVTARLTAQEQKINQEMEKRWLTRQHRDWQQVVASDDFVLWKGNVLSPEDASQLDSTWDADYISEKLTEFKSWRDRSQASKQTKQKRLEAAVAPTGGQPKPTPIQDDSFEASFNKVLQRRLG